MPTYKKQPKKPAATKRAKRETEGLGFRPVDYDPEEFQRIKAEADQLIADNAQRDELLKAMERYWHVELEPEALPKRVTKATKLTISPDPANKISGAHRLLTTTEPQFSVPYDTNKAGAKAVASRVEEFCKAMWSASSRTAGDRLEKDAVLSALLYAQVHITISSVKEMVEAAEEAGDEDLARRIRRVLVRTPVLFEVVNPRFGYPVFDRFGMAAYHQAYTTTLRELKADYPELADQVDEVARGKWATKVVVRDWIAATRRWMWIAHGEHGSLLGSGPLIADQLDRDYIPVVATITEGSRLFDVPEHQIRPFLYVGHQSGIFNRQSLALTALYTVVFAVASTALFKHRKPQGQDQKALEMDFQRLAAGVVSLVHGEEFDPMFAKGAIDPAILEAFRLAEEKGTESTIHGQTLGEPLGSNAPYSMVALLHQAGRLPLASPQMLTGWAIARALEIGLRIAKEDSAGKVRYRAADATLDFLQMPDDLELDVKLEIDLPQDYVSMVQAAQYALGAGLASREWVRENLMHIGQSETMDEAVWTERAAEAMVGAFVDMMIEEAKGQPPEVGDGGGENEPPMAGPGTEPGMPAGQSATPGSPLSRPLPPPGQVG